MIVLNGIVTKSGAIIKTVERDIIQGMAEHRIEEEPSITDRFLQGVETRFNENQKHNGFLFTTRTLSSHGRHAAEHEFGADFCGVLDVQLPNFTQSKGFLCQAKKEGNGVSVNIEPYGLNKVVFTNNTALSNLRNQITRMLNISLASFVVVYSTRGFFMIPAIDILALNTSMPVYAMPVNHFFKDFIMCFIGDVNLNAQDDSTFRSLIEASNSRTGIIFQIKRG